MKTLEINTNNEWLRAFSAIDFSDIAHSDENDAAEDFTRTLRRKLEDLGFETIRAQGQRSLLHGWNGANTFTHKIGPVGTFDELTDGEEEAIQTAINEAEAAMIRDWKRDVEAVESVEGDDE